MQSVSIIIPNYNHSKFLQERLDTILNQTYQNFEIIILDDCSNDNSREIIKSYQNHPKVTNIIFNKENSGSTFMQWELGISKAKYNLIWIAESDDFCKVTFLENAIRAFDTNPDLSLFFCNSRVTNENSNLLSDNTESYSGDITKDLFSKNFEMHGLDFVQKILINKNMIQNASAVVFKKNNTQKYLPLIKEFKMCGDWLFWSLLLQYGDVSYHKEELNFFRYINQATRNHNSLQKKRLRIWEEMMIVDYLFSRFTFDDLVKKKRSQELLYKWMKLYRKRDFLNEDFQKPSSLKSLGISKFQLIKFAIAK